MKYFRNTTFIIITFILVVNIIPLAVYAYVTGQVRKADKRILTKNNLARYLPTYLPHGLSTYKKLREDVTFESYSIEYESQPGVNFGKVSIYVQKPQPNRSFRAAYSNQKLKEVVINGKQTQLLTTEFGYNNNYVDVMWVENNKEIKVVYHAFKPIDEVSQEAIRIAESLKQEKE